MITRIEGELAPTFLMTGESTYRDINHVKEKLLDEDGSYIYWLATCNGQYLCRGRKGGCYSIAKPNSMKITSDESMVNIYGDRANNVKRMLKLEDVPFELVLKVNHRHLGDGGVVSADGTPVQALIRWDGAKMPLPDFLKVGRFFRDIYNEYRTEAASMWYYNCDTEDWKSLIPIQLGLSGGKVTYVMSTDAPDRRVQEAIKEAQKKPNWAEALETVNNERHALLAAGYTQYGTIHSHCDFSAFHSGVDDADEYGFDGIHITIGNLLSGVTFAQRIIGNTGHITLQNITDAVELGDMPIESVRDFDSVEAQLPIYQNRCFIEKYTPTVYKGGGTYYAGYNQTGVHNGSKFLPHWLSRQQNYHERNVGDFEDLADEQKTLTQGPLATLPPVGEPIKINGKNIITQGIFRGLTSNNRVLVKFPNMEFVVVVDHEKVCSS